MTLTPGGGPSPSTGTPPVPSRGDQRGSPRARPPRLRAVVGSVLRWALLLGGLVIIADLAALAAFQRTISPEDQQAIQGVDDLANYVLFSLLGILVVRDTRLVYGGVFAGVVASLLDAGVVAAARLMAPVAGVPVRIEDLVLTNLVIGVVFAGVSGAVYFLVQRSSRGRRQR